MTSAYLNRSPRSRLQAAYDVCPELEQPVDALKWLIRELPSRRDWMDPSLESFIRSALATIQAMEAENG